MSGKRQKQKEAGRFQDAREPDAAVEGQIGEEEKGATRSGSGG